MWSSGGPVGTLVKWLKSSDCNAQLWLKITDLAKLLKEQMRETLVQENEMLTDSHVAS